MSVKFTLGGIKRELRIELALAPKFEDATGLGFLALTQAVSDKTARITDVVEVLRVAFQANGVHFSSAEIMQQIQHDDRGIINAYAVAGLVLLELAMRPAGSAVEKKSQPAKRGRPNASH